MCERITAGEHRAAQASQTRSVLRAETILTFVGREDARFEHAGDGLADDVLLVLSEPLTGSSV